MKQENWEDTLAGYLPEMKQRQMTVYWGIIGFVLVCLGSLFLFRVPVYIGSPGMIRPASERVFIRATVGGIVDSVYCNEGSCIKNRSVLIRLHDQVTGVRLRIQEEEIEKYRSFIRDLETLRVYHVQDFLSGARVQTAYFRRQASQFSFHLREMKTSLDKAEEEMTLNRSLAVEKVISPKEWYDIQSQRDKISNGFSASWQAQQADWEQELLRYRTALNDCIVKKNELTSEATANEIRAPVDGIVQGISTLYPGSRVQPNDALCSVSPEGTLRVECLVPSRNIARIRVGQPVLCRVDAFNYRFFGLAGGRVLSIDNDFSMAGNEAVIRVICSIDQRLSLKKGMVCQARFMVARRLLWQLLFDRLEDWFV